VCGAERPTYPGRVGATGDAHEGDVVRLGAYPDPGRRLIEEGERENPGASDGARDGPIRDAPSDDGLRDGVTDGRWAAPTRDRLERLMLEGADGRTDR